jgi:DNA-binding NarL/FixJ family response regulator
MFAMERLTVLVVSPDPLARAGLAALVSARAELALAGAGAPGDAARLVAEGPGAVVLFDLGTAGEGAAGIPGIAATAAVVALASDGAAAGDALRAGARAVLLRGATPGAIAAALEAAARGLTVLDAPLAEVFLRTPEDAEKSQSLTPREREVLALLADGLTNKAIAARLGISEHTAKFHVNAILGKLGAGSRAEAIVRAARMGLIAL